MSILLGSTFPLSLIRRPVTITPVSLGELRKELSNNELSNNELYSFWGHSNTINIANELLGYDISPRCERPALTLNEHKLPTLHGVEFSECWVVSPDYREGFRPAIGVEVTSEQIIGWQILKIKWGQGGE